jgi:hypothetical protein
MKKLLWLAIFVAAAYSANEIRVHGIDGAFGGALSGANDPLEAQGELSIPEDAGE